MTPAMQVRAGEEGTTLLELLVAVALLALLASYAIDAIRHLQSFNQGIRAIEDANSVEAVAAHIRRTIAQSRIAFFTAQGAQARLAFTGEENRIALVTDADSRLEIGGLYLVEIGLKEDDKGKRALVAFRRAFRPSMAADLGDDDPILLSDRVASLSFRYFGSPEKDAEAAWYPAWPAAKVLPLAVEVAVTSSNGRPWPPIVVAIEAAR
jgi:general secretion pathway protein J